MKKILIILVSVCAMLQAAAQQPEKVELEKGAKLLDALSLNNGLVLKTGQEYYFRSNRHWKLSFYNPDLTLKYTVPIPKSSLVAPCELIASPSGNHVFHIMMNNKKLDIISVDSSGFVAEKKFRRLYGKYAPEAVFSDDHYLFFLIREKVKIKGERKKKPILEFVKIDIKDFNVIHTPLALPSVDPDATDWEYFANTQFVSYFVSHTKDENKKDVLRVAVISADGKLQDDFSMEINVKLGDLAPANNLRNAIGSRILVNNNHDTKVYTSTSTFGNMTTTTTTVVYSPNANSYSGIMLDPITNGFYIYGLTSAPEVDDQKHKSKYRTHKFNGPAGYFVFKFDQDGKQVWKAENKLTGTDDYFKNKALFVGRKVIVTPDFGSVRLQVYAGTGVNTYELNPDNGNLKTGYSNTFTYYVTTDDLGICHKNNKTDFSKFLGKKPIGDYSLIAFKLLDTHIVVKNYYDDSMLELYHFDE